MIIAQINPEEKHELSFNIDISGSKEEPSDIRFIIEGMPDPSTGETVQDVFTIICRAVRDKDSITVYIPRLLNIFKSGSYKSRLEVVLENRLFVPLSEEIQILEPVKIGLSAPVIESTQSEKPEIKVTFDSVIHEMIKQAKEKPKPEPIEEDDPEDEEETEIEEVKEVKKPKTDLFEIKPVVDNRWKSEGFKGIKNPFKQKS